MSTTHSQPTATALTPEGAFGELVTTMQALGRLLPAALEARFEAPPGGAAQTGGLIRNPTLDTVADPRRWALSSSVNRVTLGLRAAELNLRGALSDLDQALAAWEGEAKHSTTSTDDTDDAHSSRGTE